MKNLSFVVLISIGLVCGAAVLAGCDRTLDEVNPDPISEGAFGPGFAYSNLMGTGGNINPPEEEGGADTTSGGDTIEDDVSVGDAAGDAIECVGSPTYCACMDTKDSDQKYDEYCQCMAASSVQGGDNEIYCGCCYFGYDDSFPEYAQEWQFLVVGTCDPNNFKPPCSFDP